MTKGQPLGQALHAARRVLEGHIHVSEHVADSVLRRAAHAPRDAPPTPIETLSDRELEILALLGDRLGPNEIAERLFISPRTVEMRRSHIKVKLSSEFTVEAETTVFLGPHQAIRWLTLWNSKGRETRFLSVRCHRRGKLYVLIAFASPADSQTLLPDFEAIIRDIEVT